MLTTGQYAKRVKRSLRTVQTWVKTPEISKMLGVKKVRSLTGQTLYMIPADAVPPDTPRRSRPKKKS